MLSEVWRKPNFKVRRNGLCWIYFPRRSPNLTGDFERSKAA